MPRRTERQRRRALTKRHARIHKHPIRPASGFRPPAKKDPGL
jgi:hypothetical protein